MLPFPVLVSKENQAMDMYILKMSLSLATH
jgi:hypothetical protein